MASKTYRATVSAAVDDLLEHGFDTPERLRFWSERLKAAADQSMKPPSVMTDMLRDIMTAAYHRMVKTGKIIDKYHFGVDRFTLEQVKPELRAELDRRIMASANLITLNREEAIAKTLRRFQGWATSIPKGGTEAQKKVKAKTQIAKSLKALPFEERRVLIDQQHKLTSSLNEVIAKGGGAIAGIWRSYWRQAGYDYREDHKERDGNVYLLSESWALEQGLVKPGKAGWYTDITAVGEEVFCRCYLVYIYALGSLPSDMLTKKGEATLAEARRKVAAL